jgi:xanthine dehydrogenase accessory factor
MVVIARARDRVLRFGRNSPFFDITLPCGGGIDVHVHVRPAVELIESAADELEGRRSFDIEFDAIAGTAVLRPAGSASLGGFVRRYRPATRLLVIGQGNELAVLAQVARGAGMETIACATGPGALAAAARVNTPVLELPEGEVDLAIDPWTAVVLLFHEHRSEVPLLTAALKSDGFYVGALGSRRTHAERVARLAAAGLAPEQIARIHAPVGMIERTREGTPLAFSILADITRERMRMDTAEVSA